MSTNKDDELIRECSRQPLAIYDIAWATFDLFVVGPATTHPRSRRRSAPPSPITVRNEPELAPPGGFESAAPQLAGRAVGAHNQLAFLRALRLTAGGVFSLAGFASILALGVRRTGRRRRIKRSGRACGGSCPSSLDSVRGTKRRVDVWQRFDYRDHFNLRKRSETGKWHVDETYIKVRDQLMYLYRAIDSVGDTVEFWFSEQRDLLSAKRFFRNALARHGRPDRVVIEGSQTIPEAIVSCDVTNRLQDRSGRRLKPIRIRKSKYLNNWIELEDRSTKRRIRSMLGFKSRGSAVIILNGIDIVQMMCKPQARFAFNPNPSLAEQFLILAA